MKRNKLMLILAIFLISNSLYSQNFFDKLFHPDYIGGNIVGCRQDRSSRNSPGEGVGPGAELFIQYNINKNLFLNAGTGYITATDKFFGWDNSRVTLFPTIKLDLGYNFINSGNLRTYLNAGLLGFQSKYEIKNPAFEEDMKFDAAISGGLGLSYQLTDQWSLNASGSGNYAVTSSIPNNATNVTKPLFWFAKMGVSYALNKSERPEINDKQEIEYPFSGDEIALDDIFNSESGGQSNSQEPQQESVSEDEALDLLFQAAEEETGSEEKFENLFSEATDTKQSSDTYAQGEQTPIVNQINDLRNKINERDRIISELREKVNNNEKIISQVTGQEVSTQSDTYSNYVNNGNFTNSYKAALQFYYNKNYSQAISQFQSLMNSNPNHKLTSNCQYWIGESYFAMKNYQQALNAFKSVLAYSKSYKLDDALIMNGITYMKMGDSEMAKKNFQQLVQNYPNSEYAPKAMRYLGRL